MTTDLFDFSDAEPWQEPVGEGVVVLRRFARNTAPDLVQAIGKVASKAPFRHMVTPGGHSMSAAMTCAGELGWVTDRSGYRYQSTDPESGLPWPEIPESATVSPEGSGLYHCWCRWSYSRQNFTFASLSQPI